MAMCKFFNCNKCGKGISSWDDGNLYYFDEQGLNDTPTTLTTKTFQDVLAMIRPTSVLVVVLIFSWIPKLSETIAKLQIFQD